MKLINACANEVYDNPKEWAKDMKKGLKRDYKFYEEMCKEFNPAEVSEYLEGHYVSEFIKWFIDNYFD